MATEPTNLTDTLKPVYEILKNAGRNGMHVRDIAAEAVKRNANMGLSVEAFQARIQNALNSNAQNRTPIFAKIKKTKKVKGVKKDSYKRGWYRIIQRQTTPRPAAPPQAETAFLGKAGELAVMSELLFWGYNTSAMAVDAGVDIVVSKNDKYFHIQVKTATENNGGFGFTIRTNAFNNNDNTSMFYIFVLRQGLNNEFIIMPSSRIRELIGEGKIRQGAQQISLTIRPNEGRRRYLLNNSVNLDVYVGNFGVIV